MLSRPHNRVLPNAPFSFKMMCMNARIDFSGLPLPRFRATVAEYHRMGEAGIFDTRNRVQLIEGEVLEMAPVGALHATITDLLFEHFSRNLPTDYFARNQQPITLSDISEPEPDIAIICGTRKVFLSAHPSATDIALVIEVAQSTLQLDRSVKVPLYAAHDVAECWIVDVKARAIEQYTQPINGRYAHLRTFQSHETISPLLLPQCGVMFDALVM
jgi:Uma2 family endonuclease